MEAGAVYLCVFFYFVWVAGPELDIHRLWFVSLENIPKPTERPLFSHTRPHASSLPRLRTNVCFWNTLPRRRYPQIYASEEKLLLDAKSVKVCVCPTEDS